MPSQRLEIRKWFPLKTSSCRHREQNGREKTYLVFVPAHSVFFLGGECVYFLAFKMFFPAKYFHNFQVLKLSMRFEKLLAERRGLESSKDLNDSEILGELIQRYNSFRANNAIRKWQISADGQAAIFAVIVGLCEPSRQLLRAHLDHNKWEESGFLLSFAGIGIILVWSFVFFCKFGIKCGGCCFFQVSGLSTEPTMKACCDASVTS